MTNETLHTLETRRSCRAYKPEQITKEELEAVLRAGRQTLRPQSWFCQPRVAARPYELPPLPAAGPK